MVRATLVVALLAAANTWGAEKAKPIDKMQWWEVCTEHGRHLRKRAHDTPRAQAIAKAAAGNGYVALDNHAVLSREPRIGMDVCAAMAAYGRPNAINRSVGAWGEDQQWVYRDRRLYLYFRQDKLRSYQQG